MEVVEGVGVKVIGYERIIRGEGGGVDGGRGCGSVETEEKMSWGIYL